MSDVPARRNIGDGQGGQRSVFRIGQVVTLLAARENDEAAFAPWLRGDSERV